MIIGRFCLSCNQPIYYMAKWDSRQFHYSFFQILEGHYHRVSSCPRCGIYLSMSVLNGGRHENASTRDKGGKSVDYFSEWRPDENEMDRPHTSLHHDDIGKIPGTQYPQSELLESET